jgi:hypothetical protein
MPTFAINHQETIMSSLQETDVYRSRNEKVVHENRVCGLIILALIAFAVALVIAGALFPETFRPSAEFLVGP